MCRFLPAPSARRATRQRRFRFRPHFISIHALREEGDQRGPPPREAEGHFYPRPPRGGRLHPREHLLPPGDISIHALREEGDFFWTTRPISSQYFYPRPPRGGRLRILNNFNNVELFLSTPSARRATLCRSPSTALLLISIHALREEGDTSWTTTRSLCINFYPRPPRGGRLQSGIEYNAQIEFLSTPSARRATCHFRSIPHWRNISIHALREEGDACVGRRDQVTHQFLSTPSARRATG